MASAALRLGRRLGVGVGGFLAQFVAWCWNGGLTLHVLSILGGWALLTWGVARLLVPEVWLISAGLLLLSFAGWGHLRTLSRMGLYALSRRPD